MLRHVPVIIKIDEIEMRCLQEHNQGQSAKRKRHEPKQPIAI